MAKAIKPVLIAATGLALIAIGWRYFAVKQQTGPESFRIRDDEIQKVQSLAIMGDSQAAFRLAQYYAYYEPWPSFEWNWKHFAFWAKVSASYGHIGASKLLETRKNLLSQIEGHSDGGEITTVTPSAETPPPRQ